MSELDLVKSPRPHIVKTIEALKKGDRTAARAALTEYDLIWNGIEVYVSTRSRDLYQQIEIERQKKIEEILDGPNPNLAEALPLAESLLVKYDEAIKNSETGPALNPGFDDVATIRIARAPLRQTVFALKAGDANKASAAFHEFQHEWPKAKGLIQKRSADAVKEIEGAVSKADDALHHGKSAAEVSPLVDAVTKAFNDGLNLVVAEARAAAG